jgi:hypothetical protein
MINWKQFTVLVSATALAGFFAACGGDDSSNSGQMNLSMTDAPVDGDEAVVLTVA